MEREVYRELREELTDRVDELNDRRGIIGLVRGKEYNIFAPLYGVFDSCYDSITISFSTRSMRRNDGNLPVVVKLKQGIEDNVLNASVENEKEFRKFEETIQSFLEKHSLSLNIPSS